MYLGGKVCRYWGWRILFIWKRFTIIRYNIILVNNIRYNSKRVKELKGVNDC